MSVSGLARIRARLRQAGADQRGFTLVELLVTTSIGVVVLMAVFGLLDVSLRASSRVEDRAEVTQRGRVAMEQLTQQLRAQTCLGSGVPAMTQADSTSMTFYADLGDDTFTPQRRRLVYSNGAITEFLYAGTGTPPNMTFSATPMRTRTVVTNIVPVGSTPIFRYYAFTPDGSSPVTPSVLLASPLSTTDLARTVRIAISFIVQPTRGPQNNAVQSTFENYVYVRTSDPTDPERSPACL